MEKKYIDAEEFKNRLAKSTINFADRISNPAFSIIRNMPAADVVEVVRCKDCKYGVPTKNGFLDDMIACENKESPCGYSSWLCQPDWFCADGERREK